MSALIFDIESAGDLLSECDDTTKKLINEKVNPKNEKDIDVNETMGLSPYTGKIVVIGTLDSEIDRGAVYYLNPEGVKDDSETKGIIYRAYSTEKELLNKFWEIADKYSTFVTYNGRMFDIPYILIRSAIHNVKPTKDLMRGRYLYQQSPKAVHIDLYDQLAFYGSFRFKTGGSLHMACKAFSIKSPKDGGIDGSMVTTMFNDKKYQEIAKYNSRDLWATKSLYEKWQKYLA